EFVKLALSRARRRVIDHPPEVAERYRGKPHRQRVSWSFRLKRRAALAGVPP
ncbi:MAG: hypothetical protein JNM48_00905, partial [Rhodospirillales bacterium]|nr:hypothetical protein [Rhodospirillales bacterium]